MSQLSKVAKPKLRRILVAGDVCIDVVGVPVPPRVDGEPMENWRLTGETRTHFLAGGAMLLAKFIRAPCFAEMLAAADAEVEKEIEGQQLKDDDAKEIRWKRREEVRRRHTKEFENEIIGPRPEMPHELIGDKRNPLLQDEFFSIAERLCRKEIVHSLLGVQFFSATSDKGEKRLALRVEKEHGYSGPADPGEDSFLRMNYLDTTANPPKVIVLDDTGNRFRKGDKGNPWPLALTRSRSQRATTQLPLLVYKLHRPLPGIVPSITAENKLWDAAAKQHPHNRVVIVSIDDLRRAGAPISLGLSWERTALDTVWQLLNYPAFAELRDSPRLIVRLGLDGALLVESRNDAGDQWSRWAWLVYDADGIEGEFARKVPGKMVSCGSAFTAAFVQRVAAASDEVFNLLLKPVGMKAKAKTLDPTETGVSENLLLDAIEDGLHASRRLLQFGFGNYAARPNYPGPELFQREDTGSFCREPLTIIPETKEPDRNYWRLLDSVFVEDRRLLQAALDLISTGRQRPAKNNLNEKNALAALKRVPVASFGMLRTYDRSEIEHYRSLHTLLRDYLGARRVPRPLSIAVFGAPGAGKGFGVKQVAKSLEGQRDCRDIQELTFNLSLYQRPEELVGAFHLIRDVALRGKVALAFFDEFDTSLDGEPLGWLRHFLAPMQDGEFLDRGAPHPIGQAIFVFAGGTCATHREFASHPGMDSAGFKAIKGPDFLSRLRHALDIPSLNFLVACEAEAQLGKPIQPIGTFNPYGPIEEFPSEAAILLRRAAILQHNVRERAPELVRADKSLAIAPEVLRAFLFLPQFQHGNRSFEALLEMSHLAGAANYDPALLPPPFQLPLHAEAQHLQQLIATQYPFPEDTLDKVAQQLHETYLAERRQAGKYDKAKKSHQSWVDLSDFYKKRNYEAARSIPDKLRSAGLWFRKVNKIVTPSFPVPEAQLNALIEKLAKNEHDRWTADQRRQGYVSGSCESDILLHHPCILPWDELTEPVKDQDRDTVRNIPQVLAPAGYEVV
jgi:hypothetical protein